MKIFCVIFIIIFCGNFCTSRVLTTFGKNSIETINIEGENIYPVSSVYSTKNNKKIDEFIIKYGEIKTGQWFKPATLTTKSGQFVRCANWNENLNSEKINYEMFQNCLIMKININNYDSINNNENLKPVMVYIPGFDLSSGDIKTTKPIYLLDKDIVLVTVQYRLGVLGFLSTNTEEIPGNAGVHDVILALKWIQKYITKFGGDPNRVTIFGQYKAAGLIGILTMSPLANNLFQQVIYQSGSPFIANLTTTNPIELAQKIANNINCTNTDDVTELNKCILSSSFHNLLDAYHKIILKEDGEIPYISVGHPNNIISQEPELLVQNEQVKLKKYPTMAGVVSHPTIALTDAYNENDYSRFSFKYFEEEYKNELKNSPESDEDQELKELNNSVFNFAKTLIKGLVEAFIPLEIDVGGMQIKTDVVKILIFNKESNIPSYLYAFNYHGTEHNIPKKEGSWLINYVTLLDDEIYLFDNNNKIKSDDDKFINNVMIDLWTSFAIDGIPKSPLISFDWPQIVDTDGPYLIIDKKITIATNYSNELTPLMDCQANKDCVWLDKSNQKLSKINLII